jgi:hypothetical protein
MAKKRQFLINHHTSGLDNMPLSGDVRLGEIIVRHNDTKPEILTLKDNGEFATFIDKVAVSGMVATSEAKLDGLIDAVDAKFADYATSADTVAAIKAVDGKFAQYANSADTVAAIEAVDGKFAQYANSADTHAAIAAVDGKVDNVDAKFAQYAKSADTYSAITVVDGKFAAYATSADTVAAIEAVDGKFDDYATSADTHSAITAVSTELDSLSSKVDELVGFSANTAVQTVTITGISGVTYEKQGTHLAIDFSEAIIDGGTF